MMAGSRFCRRRKEQAGSSNEGLFSRDGAARCTAAHAMIGPCSPYAAPRDAGAVRHDMILDAHAIRRPRLLFFCGAATGCRNFELLQEGERGGEFHLPSAERKFRPAARQSPSRDNHAPAAGSGALRCTGAPRNLFASNAKQQ
jgi:hypothetical protein